MADLETLYREHYRAVYGYVLKRVQDVPVAEDIVQDTFVKAARRLHDYEDQGKPGAWLVTIARNLIADRWKSYDYVHVRPVAGWSDYSTAGMVLDPIGDWLNEQEARAQTEALQMAILSLPSDVQRQAMLLRHVEGLSIKDTAERLGLDVGAIKAACWRGTKHVAAALGVAA